MHHLHLTDDADGMSHFADIDIDLSGENFAPPAPSMPISSREDCAKLLYLVLPAGWGGTQHPTPCRQVGFASWPETVRPANSATFRSHAAASSRDERLRYRHDTGRDRIAHAVDRADQRRPASAIAKLAAETDNMGVDRPVGHGSRIAI